MPESGPISTLRLWLAAIALLLVLNLVGYWLSSTTTPTPTHPAPAVATTP